ncbi:MAG TPA: hypothetical protein VF550_02575 [Polyangia bacterium]
MTALVLTACMLATSAGSVARDLRVLRFSAVREKVFDAAVRVAGSGDAKALRKLGELLASKAFLARLDESREGQAAYSNLHGVFQALAANPSSMTEALCLKVMTSDAFTKDPDRQIFALPALAAVRPMSSETAAVFEKGNGQGLWSFNGPLLAANGSDRALALLEPMFADRAQRVDERIALTRESIVPNRTRPSIVTMVGRLVEGSIETEVALALAECLYDYQPDQWYGKRRNPPQAPSWKTASPEAQRAAKDLGRRLLARKDLPATLRTAIEATFRF